MPGHLDSCGRAGHSPRSQALGPDRAQPGGRWTDPWPPISQKQGAPVLSSKPHLPDTQVPHTSLRSNLYPFLHQVVDGLGVPNVTSSLKTPKEVLGVTQLSSRPGRLLGRVQLVLARSWDTPEKGVPKDTFLPVVMETPGKKGTREGGGERDSEFAP